MGPPHLHHPGQPGQGRNHTMSIRAEVVTAIYAAIDRQTGGDESLPMSEVAALYRPTTDELDAVRQLQKADLSIQVGKTADSQRLMTLLAPAIKSMPSPISPTLTGRWRSARSRPTASPPQGQAVGISELGLVQLARPGCPSSRS